MNLQVLQEEARGCTDCHGGPHHAFADEKHGKAGPLFDKVGTCSRGVLFVAEAPNFDDTFKHGHLTVSPDTDPRDAAPCAPA